MPETYDVVRSAGQRLRQLRVSQQLTQADVEARTERLFPGNGVYMQQISRIEKGQIERPPVPDLLRIGAVLGLDPLAVLEMYDLYKRPAGEDDEPIISQVRVLLSQLEEPVRTEFLHWLDFAVTQARVKMAELEQGRHPTPPPARQPVRR